MKGEFLLYLPSEIKLFLINLNSINKMNFLKNTKKNVSVAVALAMVSGLVSCGPEGVEDIVDNQITYTIPDTYTFERDGVSTVDFAGQTQRLQMLNEMSTYVSTSITNATTIDENVLLNMYANTNNPFSDTSLNTSGKKLKDKTAASYDYFTALGGGGSSTEQTTVRSFFESQFTDLKSASQGATAAAGVAGKYTYGGKTRLYAANGLEPIQVVLKGLMGACLLDQISNHYLGASKLDANGVNTATNTAKTLVSGKNYTDMEHAWDEAYGYVYGLDNGSTLKFWSSYAKQVNADTDFNTIEQDIKKAFIKGRAAIVNNDYVTRNAQIAIIKEKLALVSAVRAVYYLQAGKSKLGTDNGAAAFHDLSEGYGFIMALRYSNKPGTDNPYFSKTEVDAMLAKMLSGTNGFWDVDNIGTKLDEISEQIANKFGFTVAQAKTVS